MDEESREHLPQRLIDVEVRDKRQGEQITAENAAFHLRHLCRDPWTYSLGTAEKMFDEVYFRTASGNIYRLDPKGRLTNSNESRESRRLMGVNLDPRQLEQQRLIVGEPFRFGQGGHTTIITEIVAVRNNRVWQRDLPYNPIIDDFKKDLPPQR